MKLSVIGDWTLVWAEVGQSWGAEVEAVVHIKILTTPLSKLSTFQCCLILQQVSPPPARQVGRGGTSHGIYLTGIPGSL